jgi:hypothetical protein
MFVILHIFFSCLGSIVSDLLQLHLKCFCYWLNKTEFSCLQFNILVHEASGDKEKGKIFFVLEHQKGKDVFIPLFT